MDILQWILLPFTDIKILLLTALGAFAGVILGAIPGLSVTMAVALLLSLTFSWDLYPALALMIGVYFGGVFGGSRPAILMNIPGGSSNVATSFDGYPLAKRGEAKLALSLTTIFSGIGGLIGIIVLATAAPIVANIAIKFSPRDFFLVAMLGLLLVGSLSKGSLAKGIFTAGLGVLLGLVGMDPLDGSQRFTFGQLSLMNGVNFIVALLGLFGMSEVLYQLKGLHIQGTLAKFNKTVTAPVISYVLKFLPLSIRTSVLGILVGALPGVGADIAALLAYDHAKSTVKKPSRPFGKGSYEGVVAPESANNAALMGALIPMLTLGIPGDSVTAIFVGALTIQGLNPGPLLMVNNPDIFWVIVGISIVATIFIVIFGLSIVRIFMRIVVTPKQILLPIIAVISVVGTYAINNSLVDVYWMMFFAVIGLFLKINNFSVGPMVLGIILGPIVEINFRRAYIAADSNPIEFITSFFTSPISLVLTIFFLITAFIQTPWYAQLKAKLKKA